MNFLYNQEKSKEENLEDFLKQLSNGRSNYKININDDITIINYFIVKISEVNFNFEKGNITFNIEDDRLLSMEIKDSKIINVDINKTGIIKDLSFFSNLDINLYFIAEGEEWIDYLLSFDYSMKKNKIGLHIHNCDNLYKHLSLLKYIDILEVIMEDENEIIEEENIDYLLDLTFLVKINFFYVYIEIYQELSYNLLRRWKIMREIEKIESLKIGNAFIKKVKYLLIKELLIN